MALIPEDALGPIYLGGIIVTAVGYAVVATAHGVRTRDGYRAFIPVVLFWPMMVLWLMMMIPAYLIGKSIPDKPRK